jgi:hypothetical protein
MSLADVPLVFTDLTPDLLDRGASVRALRRLLESPALVTLLLAGIYGGWGTGKTSVMRILEAELASPGRRSLVRCLDLRTAGAGVVAGAAAAIHSRHPEAGRAWALAFSSAFKGSLTNDPRASSS